MDLDTNLDFSTDITYNIKLLYLGNSGRKNRSDWVNNKGELRKIVKAISESTLKDSLEEINIYNCGVTISEAKQMLIYEGVSTIKITDHKIDNC